MEKLHGWYVAANQAAPIDAQCTEIFSGGIADDDDVFTSGKRNERIAHELVLGG